MPGYDTSHHVAVCSLPNSTETGKECHKDGTLSKIDQRVQEVCGRLVRLDAKIQAMNERIKTLQGGSPSDPTLLTRAETAEKLQISVRMLDTLEAAGEIQAIRIGRSVRYHPDTIEAFIRSRSRGGGQ